MSNKPFDRNISNLREKLISGDFNLMQSYSDLAVREHLLRVYSPRVSISSDVLDTSYDARFASDGFKVRPTTPTGLSVTVSAGLGFIANATDSQTNIDSVNGLNDTNALKPVVLAEAQEFIVPPNAGVFTRVDIIEVEYNKDRIDSESRAVLNQTTGAFVPSVVDKTFSWALDGLGGNVAFPALSSQPLSYKAGSATTGHPPPITPGYTKIAEVYVAPGATAIEQENISDFRKLLCPAGYAVVSATIELPNVNVTSPVFSLANYKPTVLSLSAPAGISVSCYPTTTRKTYDFIITGNFSSAEATIRAVGSFDEATSVLAEFRSDAADARIRSIVVDAVGTTRATDAANSGIADPPLSIPQQQRAAIINFCPYQIVLDGADIKYKTIVSSADADPMTVALIAVLKY